MKHEFDIPDAKVISGYVAMVEYFTEDGKRRLVHYKTNSVPPELAASWGEQIHLYYRNLILQGFMKNAREG